MKRFPRWIPALALLLTPFAASAEDIRLDSPGGSMENLPVYDQIGNTCYAYSAAVAIDAHRNKKDPLRARERSNPLELAIGNGQLENGQLRLKETVAGGAFCDVVHYARKAGVCTLEQLSLRSDTDGNLSKLFQRLRKLQKQYGNLSRAERKTSVGAAVIAKVRDQLNDYGLESSKMPSANELERLLLKSPQDFQRAVLSDPWCDGKRTEVELPDHCRDELTLFESNEKIIDRIAKPLKKQTSLPVAVALCSKLLKKGKHYRGFSHRLRDLDFPDVDACGGHVTLVTGKRHHPKSGQLQFLIHNSWGDGCKQYSNDWDCEEGKVWVDAEALAENTYGVSWLE